MGFLPTFILRYTFSSTSIHSVIVLAASVIALMLAVDLPDLPGASPRYQQPTSSTAPKYIEVLEENTHVIYPAIAILVVVLIALGVVSAWRTEDIDGIKKAEFKRTLILELRRELHGVTAEQLAKAVELPSLKVVRLLEELQEQGITECRTDTRRHTTWHLKGLVDT